ncbi:MAG: hypothetical protein WCA20_19130 [Candidatus Sulfotelmatobacter sp.]
MNCSRVLSVLLFLIMAFSVSLPAARADSSNQETKMTFNEAVEIPGQTLPPGTYWFVVVDTGGSRNIVQIFSEDRSVLCATLMTVPADRLEVSGETTLTFAERPHSKPQALLTWFYPGETTGHEFIYPKNEEKELARDMHQKVVSEPGEAVAHSGQ